VFRGTSGPARDSSVGERGQLVEGGEVVNATGQLALATAN